MMVTMEATANTSSVQTTSYASMAVPAGNIYVYEFEVEVTNFGTSIL